ncbi:hypothetical protein BV898_02333 [Hypsibius exemplaris]|uniref:Uncharacterized protein n=1 Tax=Hypsibius exemplaris TaxID=2072580 RepID=A0A1W0X8Y7_HYPEX|nr:hypothetical protein BV898_02333 [Hypsibius exemplaris]
MEKPSDLVENIFLKYRAPPSSLNPFRPAFERRNIAKDRMLEPDSGFVRKVIKSDAVDYASCCAVPLPATSRLST